MLLILLLPEIYRAQVRVARGYLGNLLEVTGLPTMSLISFIGHYFSPATKSLPRAYPRF